MPGLELTPTDVRTPSTITPPPKLTNNDENPFAWVERIDKILGNISALVDKFRALQQAGAGIAPGNQLGTGIHAGTPPPNYAPHAQAPGGEINQQKREEKNDQMQQIIFAALGKIEEHVVKCYQENPKMPLDEIIKRAPLDAEQILQIYQLINMLRGAQK